MAEPFTEISEFIMKEIQKSRQWTANPGPQYADDPRALLHIMQHTMQNFQSVNLTQEQINRLYEAFHTEAEQFRQQNHQYFGPNPYKDVLDDIKKMLARMKTKA